MAENKDQILDVVGGFFDALGKGDLGACGELMSDDAVVWHNHDQQEQPKAEALGALGFLTSLQPTFRVVRRAALADGCVQQHVVEIDFADGSQIQVAALQWLDVAGGKITRIDEYMDSAALGAVMQKVQGLTQAQG